MRAAPVLALLLLATCGQQPVAPPAPPTTPSTAPLLLEHDFGMVPHGELRQHEFRLDLGRLPEVYVPLRVHLDCSCGTADLRLRAADGSERFVEPSGLPTNLPRDGEQLFVRVTIDTTNKEAVDLPASVSRGFVVLQPLFDATGNQRIQWPLQLRFGIACPVELRPFAALDFGKVPQSRQPEVLTTLRGDTEHAAARFGPVASGHPALTATLEPGPDHTVLRVRCRPNELGNHRALLAIDTDLAGGYRIHVPVTWKVVPDLEATPLAKISFRTTLERAQPATEDERQFVLVVDHDERRPAEFVVHRIVAADGRDVAAHFAVRFVAMPDPRQFRLHVRYTGGLREPLRGSIVLTKDGDRGPFLPIELVVFPAKDA
jgi:hypothetical protein